jgi:hypothetical protein
MKFHLGNYMVRTFFPPVFTGNACKRVVVASGGHLHALKSYGILQSGRPNTRWQINTRLGMCDSLARTMWDGCFSSYLETRMAIALDPI